MAIIIKIANIMYGRVLAGGFTSGFQQIRKFFYKHYIPHRYKFKSIVPENRLAYKYTAREHWKVCKLFLINRKIEIKFREAKHLFRFIHSWFWCRRFSVFACL